MTLATRFAPSPTGYLHLGHAYSAWIAWSRAQAAGGKFYLRLEDIDTTRCKPEFSASILEDLQWLGLNWDGEARVQSEHLPEYRSALDSLNASGLLYPCFCTRSEIARAASAPHGAGEIYPGTCRNLGPAELSRRLSEGKNHALRLNISRALAMTGDLRFYDEKIGWTSARPEHLGDVVLARRDIPVSYHLCVAHDDAAQNITHVTRGEDLAEATHVHVLLQRLLGLPTPAYAHHPLITDATGKRLAKRGHAATLRAMREAGIAPAAILARLREPHVTSHQTATNGVT